MSRRPVHLGLRSGRRRLAAAATVCLTAVVAVVVVPSTASSAATAASADWQFGGNRTSSVPGAPALRDIGTGNTFTTTTVDGTTGRRVLSFPAASGLQVSPIAGLVKPGVYSVVILYKPSTTTGYQRLTDFNSGAGETGLYSLNQQLAAYPQAVGAAAPITSTAFHQIVLTRNSAKVVTGYVDGSAQFSFTDSGDQWLASGDNIRFFKDNGGEDGAGQVARIRLFASALTGSEVSRLDRLPTDSADLGVRLTDAPDPVAQAGLLAYTATVINNGPAAAAAASVQLTYPAGASFVGSSPSAGTCAAPVSRKVTCSFGALAPSTSVEVLIVVRAPTAAGSVTGTASVSSTTTDTNATNTTASTTTRVR